MTNNHDETCLTSNPIYTLNVHITSNLYWCVYIQQWHMHMICVTFETSYNHMFFYLTSQWIFSFDVSLKFTFFLNLKVKSLAIKLLNEVSVELNFFFSNEFGRNKCVNLSGGNHLHELESHGQRNISLTSHMWLWPR